MKTSIFWDVALCKAVEDNRRFGGKNGVNLHGLGVSQARKQDEAKGFLASCLAYTSTQYGGGKFSETSVNFQ
jgi:hypothetical protein